MSLKNWDNKTWLASKKYIRSFNNFLLKQIRLNRDSQILDIGCGRGKILGFLCSSLRLKNKPIGIDIEKHLDRDKILQELNDEGINAGVVHVPNHYYTCFKDSFKELPETDYFNKHQISLPCGWWLDENDINHIANSLLEKCEKNSIIRK